VASVDRKTDADSNSENDLDRRYGAERKSPEVHQPRDANHDTHHGNGHAGDRDRMRYEDERNEQHP